VHSSNPYDTSDGQRHTVTTLQLPGEHRTTAMVALTDVIFRMNRIMEAYKPERAPEPESWLRFDEQERIVLVETWHRGARIKLPNVRLHAALHVIVENQIALNLDPVVRAMHRLRNEGLTRHDAIHAIGSVVAEHLFGVLKTNQDDDAAAAQARYCAAVERLTAASWRRGQN